MLGYAHSTCTSWWVLMLLTGLVVVFSVALKITWTILLPPSFTLSLSTLPKSPHVALLLPESLLKAHTHSVCHRLQAARTSVV